MLEKVGNFFKAMLTANGGISYGRAASLFLMIVCVVWDSAYMTFVMAHWKALFPLGMRVSEILPPVATLMGQISFVGMPYALNKFTTPDQFPDNGQHDHDHDGQR